MLKLLTKKNTKPNPDPSWSRKDLEELVRFWSNKSAELDKEINNLVNYYEKNQKSRYSRCFGLFKTIAMRRKYGDDHLGFAVAKSKCMTAAGVNYLKLLSSQELKSFQDFLTYISEFDNLPINFVTYKTWKTDEKLGENAEARALDFVLQFKSEDYSGEKANLLVARIAFLHECLLKKNVTS